MRAFSRSYAVLAVLGLFSAAGCLRKDVTHTLYMSPSGVTWSTIEKDVRSDEAEPGRRQAEEQDYVLSARAGQHGVAKALALLGGTRIQTTVLRRDRPFTIMTEGQFVSLSDLAVAMMGARGIRGDASIDRNGCERTLRVWFDVESNTGERLNAFTELMSEATSYRLVLTDGRFLRAEGFTIEEDGMIATPGASIDPSDDGIVRASLTWTEGSCAPASVALRAPQPAPRATR
jgi:hypothetical protein